MVFFLKIFPAGNTRQRAKAFSTGHGDDHELHDCLTAPMGFVFAKPGETERKFASKLWESWGKKKGFWTSLDDLEIFGIMLKHQDFLLFTCFVCSYRFLSLTSFEHFWLNSTSQLFSFLDSTWSSMEPAARLDCGYELWMICHRWHMPSRVPCPLFCMCTVSLCLRAHQSQIE